MGEGVGEERERERERVGERDEGPGQVILSLTHTITYHHLPTTLTTTCTPNYKACLSRGVGRCASLSGWTAVLYLESSRTNFPSNLPKNQLTTPKQHIIINLSNQAPL